MQSELETFLQQSLQEQVKLTYYRQTMAHYDSS
jgi:hypothetical protein